MLFCTIFSMLVDPLTADLDLDALQQDVADPVEPAELTAGHGDGGQLHAQVHAVHQITIAGNGGSDLATESRSAIEGLLNGFHGEVGVPLVNYLED